MPVRTLDWAWANPQEVQDSLRVLPSPANGHQGCCCISWIPRGIHRCRTVRVGSTVGSARGRIVRSRALVLLRNRRCGGNLRRHRRAWLRIRRRRDLGAGSSSPAARNSQGESNCRGEGGCVAGRSFTAGDRSTTASARHGRSPGSSADRWPHAVVCTVRSEVDQARFCGRAHRGERKSSAPLPGTNGET